MAEFPRIQASGNHTAATAATLLWLAAVVYLCAYLLWKLAAALFRLLRPVFGVAAAHGKRGGKEEAAPVVTWLLGPPSSSPSRAQAEQELPEYSARLLAKNGIVSYD
jgi:hypothetical protein